MSDLDMSAVETRVRRMVAAELARWQQLAAWLDADVDAAHTPGDPMTP